MAEAGVCPPGQADIAVLARVPGIALSAYPPEHVARSVPANLRAAVRWECRDLVRDPAPAGLFDLVLCRNVAIYLAAGAQHAPHAYRKEAACGAA